MEQENKIKIIEMARERFPDMKVYEAVQSNSSFGLDFHRFEL